MKRVLIASALLALTSLGAGCGLKGSLERPAPMWGSERSAYKEKLRQEAAEKEAARASQRPRVEIPVESDGTAPTAQTAPSAAAAKAGTGTSDSATSDGSPDLKQSGGAVPPVEDISRQRSGY